LEDERQRVRRPAFSAGAGRPSAGCEPGAPARRRPE
jgi:hypothetical protein